MPSRDEPRPSAEHRSPASMVARLRAAGCVYAEEEAAAIVARFAEPGRQADAVASRCAGMPLEHVVGRAEFAGITVAVAPRVFVPRRRAEALVDVADRLVSGADRLVALDLGCGSGAIAAALRRRHPGWQVHAADLDAGAVACARVNGGRFGFEVHQGHWFEALPRRLLGRLGLVVAHLPYVPTGHLARLPRDYRAAEPTMALDGGADGLDPWRAVAASCARWLGPGGRVVTQVTHAQAVAAEQVGQGAGLAVEVVEAEDAAAIVASARL